MSSVLTQEHIPTTEDVGGAVVGRTPWQLFWGRFRRDRVAIAGSILIIELVLIGFSAPLISKWIGHGPNDFFRARRNVFGLPLGPDSQFWFGNDQIGRDMFVRVVYGARTSLTVAFLATGISVLIGVILGVLAGFFGGWVDTLISRTIDIVMSLPLLLFAIGIAAACGVTATGCLGGHIEVHGIAGIIAWAVAAGLLVMGVNQARRYGFAAGLSWLAGAAIVAVLHVGIPLPTIQPGMPLVIFIIALFNWFYIARIVRGQTLSIREREFIEASRSMGAGNYRIMFQEILPNLAAPIIVYSTLIIPANILFEAALSFLGVGIPQSTPSWGRMLSDASSSQLFTVAWWMMVFPGLFLLLTTLAFNLLGDGLRDALDPRGGKR